MPPILYQLVGAPVTSLSPYSFHTTPHTYTHALPSHQVPKVDAFAELLFTLCADALSATLDVDATDEPSYATPTLTLTPYPKP